MLSRREVDGYAAAVRTPPRRPLRRARWLGLAIVAVLLAGWFTAARRGVRSLAREYGEKPPERLLVWDDPVDVVKGHMAEDDDAGHVSRWFVRERSDDPGRFEVTWPPIFAPFARISGVTQAEWRYRRPAPSDRTVGREALELWIHDTWYELSLKALEARRKVMQAEMRATRARPR